MSMFAIRLRLVSILVSIRKLLNLKDINGFCELEGSLCPLPIHERIVAFIKRLNQRFKSPPPERQDLKISIRKLLNPAELSFSEGDFWFL